MKQQGVLTVNTIDWSCWLPSERAALCFIRKNNRLLLILKSRGFGAGKVNAPGGRIEKNETSEQAVIREVTEEIGVVPQNLYKAAELSYQFTEGYALQTDVFFASDYIGQPFETKEAKPFWCTMSEIPYEIMWEDYRYWLPQILNDSYITGYFVFTGERMLNHKIFSSLIEK